MSEPTRSGGAEAFDDADVARCYRHRPPYAPAALAHVISLAKQRKRALDLGCGPGKVALALAPHFDAVDAVDPSQPMLDVARESGARNVRWICSKSEEASLADRYDLITAGTSIHWMDHAVVFPRLRTLLDGRGFVIVIHGDQPHEPPWAAEWDPFLRRWLSRMGRTYDPGLRSRAPYERWIDIAGREVFTADVMRSVAEMVECEHSRATWTRARMGPALATELDRELTALLDPYARDGRLHFTVQTQVVWGVPRSEAAPEAGGA